MRILVTGSSGHLGEALVRVLGSEGNEIVGLDLLDSLYTTEIGSIVDRDLVRRCVEGVDAILHTATLHKPHMGSHSQQDFVDSNVTGTLILLEEAVAARVRRFVYTSTTSAFGRALTPTPGTPSAWIAEDVSPIPRNIYGVTKTAAENLCELVHRDHGLPCLILLPVSTRISASMSAWGNAARFALRAAPRFRSTIRVDTTDGRVTCPQTTRVGGVVTRPAG